MFERVTSNYGIHVHFPFQIIFKVYSIFNGQLGLRVHGELSNNQKVGRSVLQCQSALGKEIAPDGSTSCCMRVPVSSVVPVEQLVPYAVAVLVFVFSLV